MSAYYNENDPDAVAVLRQFVADGIIAPGDVDARSIKDVSADELRTYTQWHFFAGAGVWSVAARLAGWADERPILTASCPCQPYSAAGKGLGADDPRHLWPDLHRLISAARRGGYVPPVLVGEQVAGKAGYGWFDGVRADLAREGIASRTVDIPACAVDAPHERNRLFWLALADSKIDGGRTGFCKIGTERHGSVAANGDGGHIVLADTEGQCGRGDEPQQRSQGRAVDGLAYAAGNVAHANGRRGGERTSQDHIEVRTKSWPARRNGSWWADAEWIICHDAKARRAKSGLPMLVDGMVGRNALWRLAGNSIVALLAAEVIAAAREVIDAT